MRRIDVQSIIDNARFTGFHWAVMGWCSLLLIFDGYNWFVYGAVLPVLMNEWGLTPLQAGALGSYALFGMMFGAVLFGTLADQIGRKQGVVLGCLIFSGASMVNGFASNPVEFGICRFIAGFGCGGLMPSVVALVNEYAPKKSRCTLVAIMLCGYPLGGMLSASVGIYILPHYGWDSMFFAAVVPMFLLPLIYWRLPESVGYILRQGQFERARAVLLRVDPSSSLSSSDELEMPALDACKASLLELLREGRALRTLMLWVAFFCCMLMVYALTSWLPKLMASAGYSLGSSLSVVAALSLGAVFGAIAGGWLGDRLSLPKVLVSFLLLAALSISLLSLKSPMPVLYLLIASAGASTMGAQILLYACAAQFYGLTIRATGMGWASGIGRNGAIVGPLLGSMLLGINNLPLQLNFMAFAVPGVVAALAMVLFALLSKRNSKVVPAEPKATEA